VIKNFQFGLRSHACRSKSTWGAIGVHSLLKWRADIRDQDFLELSVSGVAPNAAGQSSDGSNWPTGMSFKAMGWMWLPGCCLIDPLQKFTFPFRIHGLNAGIMCDGW